MNTLEIAVMAEQEQIQAPRLDATISHLRALARTARLGYALEVGGYLLDAFFDGDMAIYRSRNPQKQQSFNALFEYRREQLAELHLSQQTLRNYIVALETWRNLPKEVRERLDLGHVQKLALVPDSVSRARLAQLAVEQEWRPTQLARAIDHEKKSASSGEKRGRKPVPPAVRAVNAVIIHARTLVDHAGSMDCLLPVQVRTIRAQLTEAAAAITAALAGLDSA